MSTLSSKNENTSPPLSLGISASGFPRATFLRRVSSWVYDLLIAVAVYMVAGALSFMIFTLFIHMGAIGMNGFEHPIDLKNSSLIYMLLVDGFSFVAVGYFFVFFWTKSGQTIGMKAWRLRVQNIDGTLISSATAVRRLFVTFLGLGNIMVLFDKNKMALQDRLTKTEVVVLTLEANRGRL